MGERECVVKFRGKSISNGGLKLIKRTRRIAGDLSDLRDSSMSLCKVAATASYAAATWYCLFGSSSRAHRFRVCSRSTATSFSSCGLSSLRAGAQYNRGGLVLLSLRPVLAPLKLPIVLLNEPSHRFLLSTS